MAVKSNFTDGTALPASDINTYLTNGGLVYVTSATIGTGVSSVTVSNCFSATYDHYRIFVIGGTNSLQCNLAFQLSGITTSVYNQLGYYQIWGSAARSDYASTSTSIIACEVTSTGYVSDIEIKNPYASARKYGNVMGESTNNQYSMPFYINSTTSATGFTLTPAIGTMTGGTITVYGYRKA